MTNARVSTKGQVVIPKDIRDRLGIRAGDRVDFTVHEGHAHLEKQEGDALDRFLSGPRVPWEDGEVDRLLGERFG